MPAPPGSRDLTRIVIGILVILLLGGASLYILKPFIPAIIWATMIVGATWPLLKMFQRQAGGSRSVAVIVMMLLLLIIVIAPLVMLGSTLVEQAEKLAALKGVTIKLPGPPDWVAGIPFVGEKVSTEWLAIVAEGPESLAGRLSPYMTGVGAWLLSQLGGLGGMIVHLFLVFLLCGILYASGDVAARGVRRFSRRLHGERGEQAVLLAGASIRAVALGIVVTAVVQTVLGGAGLLIAGVPYVAVLTALMLVCCIAQIGPSLVLIGAVIWLWQTGATGWAIALAVWTVFVASLDNVLRPFLIKRGADLPLLLIMVGVIGGLFAFGIVGLFVGPVVLAVTYTLLQAWIAEGDPPTRKGS
ncbi:MAG TPA: AI-2E family transporter YdiK [Casimicrobiaceae bacterium]|nr:AI-2E family transporter YdiK [Casimicrobiaceae bacterium]